MEKIKFSDDDVFARLEDDAIDGRLNYNDFPPEEYKYFSKLARLGHLNRHKGWSAEICLQKQKEFREQYRREKERSERYFKEIKRVCGLRIRHAEAVSAMYKAETEQGVLDCALTALEALLDEPGLKMRIEKKIKQMGESRHE